MVQVAAGISIPKVNDDSNVPTRDAPTRCRGSAGGIIVRDGSRGDRKISSLARSLQDLLAASNPPAPLRLFALHSISSEVYKSVEEFAQALAFYERPNRAELIQAVHRRFHQTAPSADRPGTELPKTEEVKEEEQPA